MTAPGRYAASDGSFAKSAGSAAARGGVLIAIALVIGFALLAWGFDGGDADAGGGDIAAGNGAPDDSGDVSGTDPVDDQATDDQATDDQATDDQATDDQATDDTTPSTPTTPVVVDPPSSVTVVVLNGTGEAGLAGTRGESLGALGYVWTAGNAVATPVSDSKVYFVTGFGDEAGEVAAALSGPASVLELAPDDPTTLATDSSAEDVGNADIIVVLGTDNALS